MSSTTNTHPQITKIYKTVEEIIADQKIDISDIIKIGKIAMESVETIKNIPGEEKKKIVIAVVRKIVENKKMDDESKRKDLLVIVDNVLPNAIEVIILASKGMTKLNVISFYKSVKSIFRLCCC